MKRTILTCFLGILIIAQSWSQEIIRGIVRDSDSKEQLLGVTIVIEGTTTGTVTNLQGEFSIRANPGNRLQFSYIGYASETIEVGNQTFYEVFLKPGVEELEEVVVVGYGVQKKESVVGAISQVTSDKLIQSGAPDIANTLTGKLSGVLTMQRSGQPGEVNATTIRIRGISTWNDANPLIMVDGIERSFTDIDPNEVASISVLKDASATAVYGTKGANGVILVTTKRGIAGKPQVGVSFNQGFKQAFRIPKYYNSYETLRYANIAKQNDGSWGTLTSDEELEHYRLQDMPYIYPSVDYYDKILKDVGYSTNANVNVTGGTERMKYFTSLGYLYDGDILDTKKNGFHDPRFYYNRFNLRSNLDFDLTRSTVLSTNISGSYQLQNEPLVDIIRFWRSMLESSVNGSPWYYDASVLQQYPDPLEPDAESLRLALGEKMDNNPYSMLYGGSVGSRTFPLGGMTKTSMSTINADFILNQKLNFITEGLEVSGKLSYGTYAEYLKNFEQRPALYRLNENGSWSRFPDYDEDLEPLDFTNETIGSYYRKLYYEAKLNYARSFGNHYVTAMGLFFRRQLNNTTSEPYKLESWSGRATYAYSLKYLFEFNIGYTGSEQFAPGNRFGLFPAFALGWNISEESFIKDNLSFMNKLKIRYSYGKTGNDKGTDRWLFYTTYSAASESWWRTTSFGGISGAHQTLQYYKEGPQPNITAQWEEAVKHNLGFESGFFKNTLTFSLDFFKEDRDNILMPPNIIPQYVGVDFKDMNIGRTKNHGFEIELGYNNKTGFGLGYNVSSNLSYSENRIVFRDDPPNLPDYQKMEGTPIGASQGWISAGLFKSVDDVVNSLALSKNGLVEGDVKWIDYNADGVLDINDQVWYDQTTYPVLIYGINFGLDYKGFAFRMLLSGMSGKSSNFASITAGPFFNSEYRILEHQVDFYRAGNTDAFNPAPHFTDAIRFANNVPPEKYVSPWTYRNTDFMSLKECEISYTQQTKNSKRAVETLTVFINGNNLFIWSKINFGNPENAFASVRAVDNYPLVRRVNIGTRIMF